MSTLNNKTVLITGGASGIGRLMGKLVLEKGASVLVLWDINKHALEETEKELSSLKKVVKSYVVDISQSNEIQEAAKKTKNEVGAVDVLINNAGIIIGKYFHEHTHENISQTMAVNAAAMMHITLEFLPLMIKQNSGHIVNIASAAGMVGNPRMSVYAASKWAVIGWSDSLRIELEKLGTAIRVTCVTPYYISTGMFEGVKSSFLIPINKPEAAARKIIRGLEKNTLYVRMPLIVYTLQMIKGILPTRWFDFFVGRVLQVYRTMDEFTGRK